MGDIAEMHLDGTLCERCGEVFEDILEGNEPPGHPRYCKGCQPVCPRCKNSQINPGDRFCKICGLALPPD